jgi:insertion element IS1 protein InsB
MPTCPHCSSDTTVKNSWNAQGKQTYLCHDCQKRFIKDRARGVCTTAFKTTVLNALNERMGLRAAERVFGVHRQTILKWLKKSPSGTTTTKRATPAGQSHRARAG